MPYNGAKSGSLVVTSTQGLSHLFNRNLIIDAAIAQAEALINPFMQNQGTI